MSDKNIISLEVREGYYLGKLYGLLKDAKIKTSVLKFTPDGVFTTDQHSTHNGQTIIYDQELEGDTLKYGYKHTEDCFNFPVDVKELSSILSGCMKQDSIILFCQTIRSR